jgi:Cys-rich repeat protein
VLVAKAPTGARFNGLAVGLGGLFPAGLYASDTFNSQVVRVESTGALTPVITGVPTLGELRIDPVSKGLALRSADAALLFFLGTGTGGGLDAGSKDVAGAADARPDATAAAADGGPDAGAKDVSGGPDTAAQDASVGCGVPAAGGVCTTFPACGCPAGQACNPSSTHLLACFLSNNLADGADCSSGSTCQAGSGCFDGVCRPYCGTNADCPLVAGVQSCLATYWDAQQTVSIPGVKVCARICDPAHPQSPRTPFLSCPPGFSCSSSPTGASFCFKATPLPAGSACTSEADCPAGNFCAGTIATPGVCKQYCLTSSDCAAGTTCQFAWSPPEYAGNQEVGYCQ